MVAAQASEDEESQVTAVPPPHPSTTATKLAVSEGVTLSYRVSLTVDVKAKSDSGKASGGTEQKLILDDACGAVAPGQVGQRRRERAPGFFMVPAPRTFARYLTCCLVPSAPDGTVGGRVLMTLTTPPPVCTVLRRCLFRN